jgi:hypothetical protein
MSINYPTLYTSSASPQVILGDDITGQGADDARQGFRKYNSHVHLPFSPADFLAYNIALGDEVYIYDEDGESVFDLVDAPVIEYLSHTELRINVTPDQDIENKVLYIKAPLEDIDNAVIIPGVDLLLGSDLIKFSPETPRTGFLTPQQYSVLASHQITQNFTLVSGQLPASLPFVISSATAGWLKSINLYLSAGTGSFYPRVTSSITLPSVVEGDVIEAMGGAVVNTPITFEDTDPLVEEYPGLLTTPMHPTDLIELVIDDLEFPEGVTQVLLVGTLDILRVIDG